MFDVMQLIMVCWDLLGKVDYSCDYSIKSNQGFINQRYRELQLNGNEKADCLAKMHEVLTTLRYSWACYWIHWYWSWDNFFTWYWSGRTVGSINGLYQVKYMTLIKSLSVLTFLKEWVTSTYVMVLLVDFAHSLIKVSCTNVRDYYK